MIKESETRLDGGRTLVIGKYTLSLPVSQYAQYMQDYALQFLSEAASNDLEGDFSLSIEPEDIKVEPGDSLAAVIEYGPWPYRIYRTGSRDYLWLRKKYTGELHLAYRIANDWREWKLVADNTGGVGTDSFDELVYIFSYAVLKRGGIVFHGVIMEWQNQGILVCAHSGVGKTTHTRMWQDTEKAVIINGDRALCSKEEQGWYAYGSPWCGSSEQCLNRKVPLKAIVILEQADTNLAAVLSPYQGALELMQLAFVPDWEEELITYALDHIDDIVQGLPVVKLRCRPEQEAVAVLKEELEKLLG